MAFVFGVKTNKLRGTQLKELVYRSGSNKDNALSCYVKAFLKLKNGQEVIFKRTVKSGTSEYSYNNKVVSAEEYNQELLNLNLLVDIRNFIVFQVCFGGPL